MPRLSIPLTEEQHRAIKAKAAGLGVPLAEVARRLLFSWLADDVPLPQGNEHLARWDAAVDYYAGNIETELEPDSFEKTIEKIARGYGWKGKIDRKDD